MSKKLDCKIKRLRNLKISTIIIVTLIFVLSLGCEKEPVVEKQEEKRQETVPSEVKETTPKTTQKETPPVVEETPEEIEWEGITFSPIEGLRFDKGIFYFLEGNKYGGEVGEKAGVLIPRDAVEIDEVNQGAFGFDRRVVEAMQKEIMEKDKEFKYPLPFNLEEAKGIKIKEIASTWVDDALKSNGKFWDNNAFLAVSNLPLGAKIYAPVSTPEYLIWDNNCGRNDPTEPNWYSLDFGVIVPETYKEVLLFKNERVDVAKLNIGAKGINLLPPGFEKNIVENEYGAYSFLTVAKIGEPIAEVVSEEYLPFSFGEETIDSNVRSITLSFSIYRLKDKDSMVDLCQFDQLDLSKISGFGLKNVLKIENIPVFIKPAL